MNDKIQYCGNCGHSYLNHHPKSSGIGTGCFYNYHFAEGVEFCDCKIFVPVVSVEEHRKLKKQKDFHYNNSQYWKRYCKAKDKLIKTIETTHQRELNQSRKHLDAVIRLADKASKDKVSLEWLEEEAQRLTQEDFKIRGTSESCKVREQIGFNFGIGDLLSSARKEAKKSITTKKYTGLK